MNAFAHAFVKGRTPIPHLQVIKEELVQELSTVYSFVASGPLCDLLLDPFHLRKNAYKDLPEKKIFPDAITLVVLLLQVDVAWHRPFRD